MQKLFEQQGKDRVVNVRVACEPLPGARAAACASASSRCRDGPRRGLSRPRRLRDHRRRPRGRAASGCARCCARPAATTRSSSPRCRSLFGLAPDDARHAARAARRARSRPSSPTPRRSSTGNPDLPRLFLLEEEYRRAVLAAELSWLRGVIADLARRPPDLERGVAARDRRRASPPRRRRRRTRMTPTIEAHGLDQALRQDHAPSTGSTSSPSPARSTAVLGPNGAGKTTLRPRRRDAAAARRRHAARRRPRRPARAGGRAPARSASPASSPRSSRR